MLLPPPLLLLVVGALPLYSSSDTEGGFRPYRREVHVPQFRPHNRRAARLSDQMHFDGKYGPTWHCIVGSDFRAFVTHEAKNFIFFYVGKRAVCLYKAG